MILNKEDNDRLSTSVGVCVAFALTVGLTACERSPRGAATQVVAKVNDREITVSQLNQALDTTPAAEFGEHSTQVALAGLVDEELLFQEATVAKLDRDPDVLLAMERSKRRALVRAYLERSVYPRQAISEAEKHKYYDDNPVLFANRRVFHVMTFNTKEKALSQALQDDLKSAPSVAAVQDTLSRHNLVYVLDESAAGPEDLPLSLLPKFAKAVPRDVITAPLEDGTIQVISITAIGERPWTYDQASGRIESWLRAKRRDAARADHLSKSRAAAKITYTGVIAGTEGAH